jgi:tellurite resistance protein TerC
MTQFWLWIGFTVFVLGMLAIDLGVLNRKAHVISVREAARWTALVVALASLFNFGIFYFRGSQPGLEFLTGYLIELALSVDNIFVFVLVFAYFRVPPQYQHRVLFWGIFGALVMRGAMIGAGVILLERFDWIIYVFGAFLVFTGIKMATQDEMDIEPEANPVLKLIRRFVPVSGAYEGQRFFTRALIKGRTRRVATPLFIVLIMVETTDLVFAVDSIPAIFAITQDPFIVYTSNVFAILGLRSMYFLLAGIIDRFYLLKIGLSVILVFVGVKMLITYFDYHIPIGISLGFVGAVLLASVLGSLAFPKVVEEHPPVDDPQVPLPGEVAEAEKTEARNPPRG